MRRYPYAEVRTDYAANGPQDKRKIRNTGPAHFLGGNIRNLCRRQGISWNVLHTCIMYDDLNDQLFRENPAMSAVNSRSVYR